MTDDQKWLIDILATRRAWAWNSFHTRREFEWKVTIGIWTALAASISLLLTKDTAISLSVKTYSVVAVFFLFALHFYFLLGLTRANDFDRETSDLYDALLDREIHLNELKEEHNEELNKKRQEELLKILLKSDAPKKHTPGILNYSPLSQLLVTLLLGVCAISIIRSSGNPPSAHLSSECSVVNQVGDSNAISK